MRLSRSVLSVIALLLIPGSALLAQQTQIRWLGHAAFSITTPKGAVLLVDPWLTNPANPDGKNGKDPLAAIARADYILLTHGHRDHVGEAAQVAQKTGALLIANPELAGNLVKLASFPAKQAQSGAIMGIGGEITIADGEVTVAMVPAVHSSSVYNAKAGPTEAERAYAGNPAGFVIIVKGGPTIYHSGDTAFFRDMETIGEQYPIDLALVNIGGHYGMEANMAARAAKAVRARLAVPHHFGSEGMTPDAKSFAAALKTLGVPFHEMQPGDTLAYKGHGRVTK
jgi:L-ascorbate metabolism protein UlaG (beta-lactamase superfamily)